jgi:hypothetical protein
LRASYLAYSSTLKLEAICFPETSVDLFQITPYYIADNCVLLTHSHHSENLKCSKAELCINTYSLNIVRVSWLLTISQPFFTVLWFVMVWWWYPSAETCCLC